MPTWTTMNDLETGDLVTEADMDALRGNLEYLLDPNKQRILRDNTAAYSTTSTSFVDVDATNLAITLTTHGGPVLVLFGGVHYHSGGGGAEIHYDVAVDGTRLASSFSGGLVYDQFADTRPKHAALAVLLTDLSAGSHTFKLQWKTNSSTAYLYSQTAQTPVQFAAIEL
jgi:hypothetical protein